jgi:hypothetical protein
LGNYKRSHLDAYMYYMSLGRKRSLKKVAEKYKRSLRSVERWSSEERWGEQIKDIQMIETMLGFFNNTSKKRGRPPKPKK